MPSLTHEAIAQPRHVIPVAVLGRGSGDRAVEAADRVGSR